MKVTITITGTQNAIEKAKALNKPSTLKRAHKIAGRALCDYIADFYREKGEEHWQNLSLPTHGPGRRSTRWATKHLFGWRVTKILIPHNLRLTPKERWWKSGGRFCVFLGTMESV